MMLRKRVLMVVLPLLCLFFSMTAFADFSNLTPSQPANFEAVLKNDGTVVLTWHAALYADGYNIEKSFDGENYEIVAQKVTENDYVDNARTGHRYYRITPYNENGRGIQAQVIASAQIQKGITYESEREFIAAAGVDNYLYALGTGDNILTVFEIGDKEISLIKDVVNEKKFTPQLIYASGDYLYITSKIPRGGNNVMVYSIKDRKNPVFKKAIKTVALKQLCKSGDYLFGAAGSSGVAMLNIKDPEQIKFLTYIPIGGTANACYVSDNLLYVATSAGQVKCYNITEPRAAFTYDWLEYDFETYIWQLTIKDNWTGEPGGQVRTYSFPANFSSLVEKSGILYAGGDYGVKISDFTSYKKPVYVTPIDSTLRKDLALKTLVIDGDLLYSIRSKNIHVYNIQNPLEAIRTNTYYPLQGIDIIGTYMLDNQLVTINADGLITVYNK